jgi:DNA-binding MarR family transcriptional regulator
MCQAADRADFAKGSEKAGKRIGMPQLDLSEADYVALAEFRFLIRCFLEFSENAAKRDGLSPKQHQALLEIKGLGRGKPIAVGDLAARLRIRHNTAVELADRLVERGLVERIQDESDHRRVLLRLTHTADRRLAKLSSAHLDELSRIRPMLAQVLRRPS